jgi:hypothetical protein
VLADLESCIAEGAAPCRGPLPFRSLIQGGDDIKIVCRADIALALTTHLLRAFEDATAKAACGPLKAAAGIAIVKHKAPMQRAIELAESLLEEAKHAGRDASRISWFLCTGGIPRDLTAERHAHWRASDGQALTCWPRTIDEVDTLQQQAAAAVHLPRTKLRPACDLCRQGADKADPVLARLRETAARGLGGRSAAPLTETINMCWQDSFFSEGRTTLLDLVEQFQFIPPARREPSAGLRLGEAV